MRKLQTIVSSLYYCFYCPPTYFIVGVSLKVAERVAVEIVRSNYTTTPVKSYLK